MALRDSRKANWGCGLMFWGFVAFLLIGNSVREKLMWVPRAPVLRQTAEDGWLALVAIGIGLLLFLWALASD